MTITIDRNIQFIVQLGCTKWKEIVVSLLLLWFKAYQTLSHAPGFIFKAFTLKCLFGHSSIIPNLNLLMPFLLQLGKQECGAREKRT